MPTHLAKFQGGSNAWKQAFAKPFIKSHGQCYRLQERRNISQDNAIVMKHPEMAKLNTAKASFSLMLHVHCRSAKVVLP